MEYQFCQTGDGDYVVRKTHLRSEEWDGNGKMVFIQRDPRDVAVAAMFYWSHVVSPSNAGLTRVINSMTRKDWQVHPHFIVIYHNAGAYKDFVRGWMQDDRAIKTRYELLHTRWKEELRRIVKEITGVRCSGNHIERSYKRQRFDRWASKYPHSMRKGVVGDWKNYFRRNHGKLMAEHLNGLMLEQNYITSPDWWKELPV